MTTGRKSGFAGELPYVGLLIMSGFQVLVAVLLLMNRQGVWEAVRAHHTMASSNAISGQVNGVVYGGAVMHVVIALLYLRLAVSVRVGRLRIWSTAIVVLTTLGGLAFLRAAPSMLPQQYHYIVLEQAVDFLVRLATLWAMWFAPGAHEFFRAGSMRVKAHGE